VTALVPWGWSCSTYSSSGADAGRGDDADAGADGAAPDGAPDDDGSTPPNPGCFDAGPDDGAAFVVSEDFRASGCDGWYSSGAGLTVRTVVDASCGVSACEVCVVDLDAGGPIGNAYPIPLSDGGSYAVSGWLIDHDAGPAATYVLSAAFALADTSYAGSVQATAGLTSDWTLATSAVTPIAIGANKALVTLAVANVQPGGCLRITHIRVARFP
jgi:hypothetical protein